VGGKSSTKSLLFTRKFINKYSVCRECHHDAFTLFFGKMVTFVREVGRERWGESAEKKYVIYRYLEHLFIYLYVHVYICVYIHMYI